MCAKLKVFKPAVWSRGGILQEAGGHRAIPHTDAPVALSSGRRQISVAEAHERIDHLGTGWKYYERPPDHRHDPPP